MGLISKEKTLEKLNELQNDHFFNIASFKNFIKAQPEVEQKKGKWLEKHHEYADEGSVIDEWQSCKCSICGRYETRPYMYYFSEPNYCSYCGADMRGERDDSISD